ncbi:MAG: Maf-like protein [Gammaproteobacteria bacterium]|nr:Maf-like protein [Gammaproteobacteria bacterium]
MAQLYLASTSPRRAELLRQIEVDFESVAVDIAEVPLPDEDPERFVRRMATAKAQQGRQQSSIDPRIPVLGADTVVIIDQKILGKPADKAAALAMLRSLSGRQHRVLTAVAVASSRLQLCRLSETRVRFRPLDEAEITTYWDSGEPADKAGAYAIQGLAAAFISEIEGSYSGVMGLPLYETAELLTEFNLPFGLSNAVRPVEPDRIQSQ